MTVTDPLPLVGVVMGSDSDLPTMRAAVDALAEFDVPTEIRILSAHRTPDAMLAYAREAAARGLKVIVAGAGGAAHLPGMIAAATPLPVIGVPVAATQLAAAGRAGPPERVAARTETARRAPSSARRVRSSHQQGAAPGETDPCRISGRCHRHVTRLR